MSIKIENIFYTYMKKTPSAYQALKGVSLEINQGDFVSIIGETGSGKSTLIQHLNALLIPDEGNIQIDEYIITNKKNKNKAIRNLRKHVGVVFQFPEYQLFEDTVEKDVAYGPKNFGCSADEALNRAHEALNKVGLDESFYKRSPFELSGGEKRRAAIAGILAIDPDILVLDEPTAGLDPQGKEMILSLIKKMNEDGKTIIIVTHDMDIVLKYTDKVFVLKDGNLAFSGSPNELFAKRRNDLSIEIPKLYEFIYDLNERGFNLDIRNIRTIEDLIKEITKNG